jgi:hypothetical protein
VRHKPSPTRFKPRGHPKLRPWKAYRRLLAGSAMAGLAWLAAPHPVAAQTSPVDDLYAAGDISPEPTSTTTNDLATADLIASGLTANPSAVVLPIGDTQYENGALAKYQAATGYVASWGRSQTLGRTCAVAGNHEYMTAGAAGFFAYLGPRAKLCAQSGRPDLGYYAYTRPNTGWRIYALSSDCGRQAGGGSPSCAQTSAQVTWLVNDLNAHRTRCALAYFHHPRWATKAPWPDDVVVQQLWNAFAHRGGDLVVVGHNHGYERFTSMTTSGTVGDGPREIVVGTGGRSLIGFSASAHVGSKYRDAAQFGIVHLTLTPTSWASEFQRTDGTVVDKVGAGCR